MSMLFTDITVRTRNAEMLDQTLQQLPGCAEVVIEGSYDGDVCTVRVFSGLAFLKFALPNQGYGEIVEEDPPN